VTATAGNGLTIAAADGVSAYGQIGHGGVESDGGKAGVVTLDAGSGALTLDAGDGENAYAQAGHGGNGTDGTKTGDIGVTAGAVALTGGGIASTDSTARIGHGGVLGSGDIAGDIAVTATAGGVSVDGGLGAGGAARIGQGGAGYAGVTTAGNDVAVDSATEVILQSGFGTGAQAIIGGGGDNAFGTFSGDVAVTARGGDVSVFATGGGVSASAQIGNSAPGATFAAMAGDVDVRASRDVNLLGGTSGLSFAQIGSGGFGASGAFSGTVKVDAGRDVLADAGEAAAGGYAKIGHGDDLLASLGTFAGSGTREGDVQVGAGNGIFLSDAMIGHVNAATSGAAAAVAGDTYVAPSRDDPSGGTGILTADAATEFASAPGGELRFYFTRRANNAIAAGALLNGAPYVGTSPDPSVTQRADEFAINVLGVGAGMPAEHQNLTPYYGDNLLPGDLQNGAPGSYSTALGNYSLYYDTITLTNAPPPPPPGGGDGDGDGGAGGPEPVSIDFLGLLPDDEYLDDRPERYRERYNRLRLFSIRYEGFDHYGLFGESTYDYEEANGLDTAPPVSDGLDFNGFPEVSAVSDVPEPDGDTGEEAEEGEDSVVRSGQADDASARAGIAGGAE